MHLRPIICIVLLSIQFALVAQEHSATCNSPSPQKRESQVSVEHLKQAIAEFDALVDPLERARKAVAIDQLACQLNNAQSFGYRGYLYEQMGRYDEALQLTQQAIFATQTSRGDAEQAWLIRWTGQKARILSRQDKIDDAMTTYQHAIEMLIPEDCEGKLTTFQWDMREAHYDKLRPLFFELIDLLLQKNRLSEVQQTIEKLKIASVESYFGDSCLAETQKRITSKKQTMVDENTLVVYPLLLDNRLELLVMSSTPDNQLSRPNPILVGKKEVDETLIAFRNQLINKESDDYLPNAQKLYDWLIKPLEPFLVGKNTLVFVPEGLFNTIPLVALHDGKEFLVHKQFATAIVPALGLSIPSQNRLKLDDIPVLVAALTEATQGYPALPYAHSELKTIAELYPQNYTLLENRDFTVDNLQEKIAQKHYVLVHLLSHANFAGRLEESFVVTKSGKLCGDKFKELFKFKKATELLTLSACSTAEGDGGWSALGLSGIAMRAGVSSALATLWKSPDLTTAWLIKRFYQRYKEPTVTKAQALQTVQQSLLASQNPTFSHPFYWAHLVLIGFDFSDASLSD